MRLISLLLFLALSWEVSGQRLLETLDPNMMNSQGTLYAKRYRSISGSPYLEDEMFRADIALETGKVFKDEMINLDLVSHGLLVEMRGSVSEVDADAIASFSKWGENGTEVFEKILFNGKPHFARLMFESDDLKFYALKTKQIVRKAVQASSYNDENSINDFFAPKNYFVTFSNNELVLVLEESRNAYKDLAHQDELKEYIKNNKLKFKDEADYQQLILYYLTLN